MLNKRRKRILKCIKSIYRKIEYRPNTSIQFSVKVGCEGLMDDDISKIADTDNKVGYMLIRHIKHINGYMLSFQRII